MAYQVTIKKRAFKQLKKIKEPYYSNIKRDIFKLADDPRPRGHIKLKGRNAYRIRIADYRVIYQILDDVLVVDVIDLGHRGDIYR